MDQRGIVPNGHRIRLRLRLQAGRSASEHEVDGDVRDLTRSGGRRTAHDRRDVMASTPRHCAQSAATRRRHCRRGVTHLFIYRIAGRVVDVADNFHLPRGRRWMLVAALQAGRALTGHFRAAIARGSTLPQRRRDVDAMGKSRGQPGCHEEFDLSTSENADRVAICGRRARFSRPWTRRAASGLARRRCPALHGGGDFRAVVARCAPAKGIGILTGPALRPRLQRGLAPGLIDLMEPDSSRPRPGGAGVIATSVFLAPVLKGVDAASGPASSGWPKNRPPANTALPTAHRADWAWAWRSSHSWPVASRRAWRLLRRDACRAWSRPRGHRLGMSRHRRVQRRSAPRACAGSAASRARELEGGVY